MQEALRNDLPSDSILATAPTRRLRWWWIALVVSSALLVAGWPLPNGVSGESSGDATVYRFELGSAAVPAPSSATNLTSEALRAPLASYAFSEPVDELAETHDLLVRYWTAEPIVPAAVVVREPASVEPTSVARQSDSPGPAQTVAAPAVPVVVSPPPVEPATVEPTTAQIPSGSTGLSTLSFSTRELGLFEAMNVERIANGLPALIAKDQLTSVARWRSEEMVELDYFAHFYSGGTSAYEFLAQAGARFSTAGENLAKVGGDEHESVATAIKALMESPTHRDNILDPDFVRVGVGAVTSESGVTVFTMIYADR